METQPAEGRRSKGLGDHRQAQARLDERQGGGDLGDFLDGARMKAMARTEGDGMAMKSGGTLAGDEDERLFATVFQGQTGR